MAQSKNLGLQNEARPEAVSQTTKQSQHGLERPVALQMQ